MTDADRLLNLLIGDKHRHLYLSNAEFKSQIDAMARLMPSFIDYLANNAADQSRELAEARMRMMQDVTWPFGLR